jgi:hypothetical protein
VFKARIARSMSAALAVLSGAGGFFGIQGSSADGKPPYRQGAEQYSQRVPVLQIQSTGAGLLAHYFALEEQANRYCS